MIENLLIVGGVVCGIIFCIVMTVLSTKDYIILKKIIQKNKEKPRKKTRGCNEILSFSYTT